MAVPTLDPLHQRIYNYINPCRGNIPENVISTIAGNISFVIRHVHGPIINPDRVSIPVVDIGNRGHRAAVVVHKEELNSAVVVEARVNWGENAIVALGKKVDRMINELLDLSQALCTPQ
ncbi:hypothetical protein BU26DRAFT_561770 [Trematosphaeria pertusa]|uniref:Uncharacterized protein n=1 Tax=Trematosphaeria pertusa TaxID=390896 RepID=A0A6A6INF1_9PLEO|nr:uncharacterized protein BU26DRAFT_561770 [Trematosphaeria pertusa]KAF2251991.1 hypothetical protein BU26DRAFT_561770 [Trematosphaeria pertusa]